MPMEPKPKLWVLMGEQESLVLKGSVADSAGEHCLGVKSRTLCRMTPSLEPGARLLSKWTNCPPHLHLPHRVVSPRLGPTWLTWKGFHPYFLVSGIKPAGARRDGGLSGAQPDGSQAYTRFETAGSGAGLACEVFSKRSRKAAWCLEPRESHSRGQRVTWMGLCLLLGWLKPAEGSWEHRAVGMSRCEVYSGKGKMCIIGGEGLFLPR